MSDQLSSDLASLKISREAPSGSSPTRRIIPAVLALALLLALILLAFQALKPRIFKSQVAVTEISMISPVQGSIQVTSTGYVVPQRWSKVGSKIPGRIAQVLIREGDTVKAGQVIALLDAADQKSVVAAARARVAVARARGETARANYVEVKQQADRAAKLLERGAVGRAEFEDIEARAKSLREMVKASDAEAEAAQAEVESLQVSLRDRTLTSPIDGIVIAKPTSVGETVGVSINENAYFAEIADFDSLMVETDVPETRLERVKPGTPAEIVLDAYPSRRYRGEAVEIGRKVNRAKATVVVKVKFKDTVEGVLPDMAARVSFLDQEIAQEALQEKPKRVVAASAVVDREGGKAVWVVEDGKLRPARVSVGGQVGGSAVELAVELLDGPQPGTRVVSQPSGELYEGQRIKEAGQ